MKYSLVVIGTSLGGIHALNVVLSDLNPDFPLPVVIVQHRGSEGGNTLAEVLQEHCALPVGEAADKEAILGGRVYLAPPDYHLLVESNADHLDLAGLSKRGKTPAAIPQGHFSLTTEEPVNYARPSIDVLFESVAALGGKGAIGVLLTGAGIDGARGLALLHRKGGLAIVQEPATAQAPGMPVTALQTREVDLVLPLRAIGPFLQTTAWRPGNYI